MHWTPACAGMTCALDSRLRWNDLRTGFPPARERLMHWIPACAGMTCELGSRLRGNDLCVAHCVAHGAIHLCLPTDFVFC